MQVPDIKKKGAPRWGHFLLALFAVSVWGGSFAVTRTAVREIPPFCLAFLRFFLAALLLYPFVWRSRIPVVPQDRLAVFGLGFAGVTLYFGFENIALGFTTASHAALIIAIIPLATALTEARRVGRTPSRSVLGGLLLALAGVGLLFRGGDAGGGTLFGNTLMLGAVVCWIVYTVLIHRIGGRYPDLFLTWLIMAVGGVTLLPPALLEFLWIRPSFPSAAAWGGVGFLGIVCSALAYHAWNRALAVLGGTTTNALLYGVPLTGVLAGVVFLGEPLTWATVVGGGAIVLGVFMAEARGGIR